MKQEFEKLKAAAQAYWDASDALMTEGDYGPCCLYCGAFPGKTHDEECEFANAEKRLLALLTVEIAGRAGRENADADTNLATQDS